MDSITLQQVLAWLWDHIVGIIVVLSVFFEISKIKINPISWVMNLLFKPLRKDMDEMKNELNASITSIKNEMKVEIESIKTQQISESARIDSLIEANEMAEISRIRWEIIEFSNSIENEQKHTRDEYRHIKDNEKRYHNLIEKYKLENGIIDEEMYKINKRYDENKGTSTVYF